MQPCQQTFPISIRKPPHFDPFLRLTFRAHGDSGSSQGFACYNQKHNMIIFSCFDWRMKFYDATTCYSLKERNRVRKEDMNQPVISIAYSEEKDLYLFGDTSGLIHLYNPSSNELKTLQGCNEYARKITFLSSDFYAFSLNESKELCIGKLDDDNVVKFDLQGYESVSLHYLSKSQLLFSGLDNGSLRIFRTNKLPDLKEIGSIQAHKTGESILTIQSIYINKKEYLVTTGSDGLMKIWHMIKGRMRLIKVIQKEDAIYSWVYLENYKMIAILSEESDFVEFLRFPSGKMERRLDLDSRKCSDVFLMKERNMIVVTDFSEKFIHFIDLDS